MIHLHKEKGQGPEGILLSQPEFKLAWKTGTVSLMVGEKVNMTTVVNCSVAASVSRVDDRFTSLLELMERCRGYTYVGKQGYCKLKCEI